MSFLNSEVRPGNVGQKFDDIGAFFTSSYVFASKFISNKIVLDSGCGTGYGAKYLAENGARFVIGVDVDRKVITKCKEQYGSVGNLKFTLSKGSTLGFKDNFFDIVISIEVIEHIRDYKGYIGEVYRVLKKGGMLIISTPNKNIFSPGLSKPIMVHHIKEFYPRELTLFLNNYFSDVRMYGKFIINPHYLKEQKKFQNSWRYSLTRILAKSNFIKIVAKHIPYSIRLLISGREKFKLRGEDVLISERNIERALSLLAVCRK